KDSVQRQSPFDSIYLKHVFEKFVCEVLRYPEPQLSIEIQVVVPGEDVSFRPLCKWQAHHLGETSPGAAIEVRDPLGSDDGDIARTLDHNGSTIQPGIIDPFAFTC